jgi:hypothetical protein|tara:strand:+ start:518 stop:691 length:174 start_codon:yes stop_codon:yes gene_type:complete
MATAGLGCLRCGVGAAWHLLNLYFKVGGPRGLLDPSYTFCHIVTPAICIPNSYCGHQ